MEDRLWVSLNSEWSSRALWIWVEQRFSAAIKAAQMQVASAAEVPQGLKPIAGELYAGLKACSTLMINDCHAQRFKLTDYQKLAEGEESLGEQVSCSSDQRTMKEATKDRATSLRLRRIEGRHNGLVKELRRAFTREEPTSDGYSAIEGLRILEEAIRSGLRFRAVFFSESAEPRAERLLSQLGSQVETLLLPDKLFASVVPSETPQGVAALARWKQFSLEDVLARAKAGPLLVIAGVQDPGNLGTILRSAEAFGAGGVVLGEGTVSPFNPKVVRASAGSVFRLPLTRTKMSEALDHMKALGLRLVATASHKGTPLDQANLSGTLAIFVGSEGAGVSRDLIKAMDEVVAIPQSPQVDSLNVGVAASIVLYEVARQRK